MHLNQSNPMLVTCIAIPVAAALATALFASFSIHASTVCISVSLTRLTAFSKGQTVLSSLPKQTLSNQRGGHQTLYMTAMTVQRRSLANMWADSGSPTDLCRMRDGSAKRGVPGPAARSSRGNTFPTVLCVADVKMPNLKCSCIQLTKLMRLMNVSFNHLNPCKTFNTSAYRHIVDSSTDAHMHHCTTRVMLHPS